ATTRIVPCRSTTKERDGRNGMFLVSGFSMKATAKERLHAGTDNARSRKSQGRVDVAGKPLGQRHPSRRHTPGFAATNTERRLRHPVACIGSFDSPALWLEDCGD